MRMVNPDNQPPSLERAGKLVLEAVKELRRYIAEENMDSDDTHLKFCQATIKGLQQRADRLCPPKEGNWGGASVVPFRPRMRG